MDAQPLLQVRGLRTHFETSDGAVRAVDGVDLTVPRGRTVCVVGESGCGKSVTARSILGLVDRPGRIVSGEILWRRNGTEEDLATLEPGGERLRSIRGGEIGMIFQEPMASLSPMYTIGNQLVEAIRLHLPVTKDDAWEQGITGLKKVGIPRPEERMNAYPFQLSGGMCQRAMIAIALAANPALLIADEPTTALDVTTQARILELVRNLQEESDLAVLFITHDLGVVAQVADEVSVMYLGKVVEHATVEEIFHEPKHPYTQALLRSVPKLGADRTRRLVAVRGIVPAPSERPAGCTFHTRCDHAIAGICDHNEPVLTSIGIDASVRCHLYELPDVAPPRVEEIAEPAALAPRERQQAETEPLLELRGLTMHFPVRRGVLNRTVGQVHAVDGVDLTISKGRTLGLVGESGCGKTTLGRCLVRSIDATAGEILYRNTAGNQVDLAKLSGSALREYWKELRVIFQDPFSSLNPRKTLLQVIGEPLRVHNVCSGSELEDRVADMLQRVGLQPEHMRRYPHAFSGGERQRVNIARALILNPRLVVCDEAVSALDVSIRAQILNLLQDLQEEFDLTYLFISHDLSVVEHICDEVAVMYLGQIVEQAPTDELFAAPRHPYTEALLDAVPAPDPRQRDQQRIPLPDDLPDPANPPAACRFHTRCSYRRDGLCDTKPTELLDVGAAHTSACHLTDQLELAGIAHSREAQT